jgi:hypothetical protein
MKEKSARYRLNIFEKDQCVTKCWSELQSYSSDFSDWYDVIEKLKIMIEEEEEKEDDDETEDENENGELKVRKHKNDSLKVQWVFATEDLTVNDIFKLRTIDELKTVFPHSSTINKWRKQQPEGIWDLDLKEVKNGIIIDSQLWSNILVSKYSNELSKCYVETNTNALLPSIVATIDFAKAPDMTLIGLQLNSTFINQSSSSNYHLLGSYFGDDSHSGMSAHCSNLFHFLEKNSVIQVNDNLFPLLKETLLDFSGYQSLLCTPGIDGECKCFLCDGLSSSPKCSSYTKKLIGHEHKFLNTHNLEDEIRNHYPRSLVNMKLIRMRLDWGLHGKKCIINNFINSLYSMVLSSNALSKAEKDLSISNFSSLFISKIRHHGCIFKKGSFKLSGVEASKFMKKDNFVDLITALTDDNDILILFEKIVELFSIIGVDREEKKKDTGYVEKLKLLAEEITIRWYIRLGSNSLDGKIYLHMITHLWELENYCLLNNLSTVESYNMQGFIYLFLKFRYMYYLFIYFRGRI